LPTTTFFNLPSEKRDRIINAAMQEFATYSFDQSSIARIIENAGIPRGSFYQYFGNLKDLYKYIFDLVADQKLKYFSVKVPDLRGEGFDFFHTLRELFTAGIQFARENPELLAIGNRFLKDTNATLRQEILDELLPKSNNFYSEMIQRGLELGQLDPNINVAVATLFMNSLNTSIIDYYATVGPEFLENLAVESTFMPMVDDMIYLLTHGLKNKTI
jgi:AcrR family transcriptional regulator